MLDCVHYSTATGQGRRTDMGGIRDKRPIQCDCCSTAQVTIMTPLYSKYLSLSPHARQRLADKLGPLEPITAHDLPAKQFLDYACQDAVATYRVWSTLLPRCYANGLDNVIEVDHAIIPMVDSMMGHGMRVDPQHFEMLCEALPQMMEDKQSQIRGLASIENVGIDDQVAELLFNKLGLPYLYMTDTGARPSVNQETLEAIKYNHPIVGLILEWRELETLLTTFARPLLQRALHMPDQRIHPNILLTRQPHGRLTTKEPNLLAMPFRTVLGRLIREGFIPTPGYSMLSVDFSHLEARVLAHLSGDAHLCEIFHMGGDPFRIMAGEWYGCPPSEIDDVKRYVCKHNFYGIQNGLTPQGLSTRLIGEGMRQWTVDKVKEYMAGFFKLYPGIARVIDKWHAEARQIGMVRGELSGRYRYLPQVRSIKKNVREYGLRAAQNFNMPDGASLIMKRAMKMIWDDPVIRAHMAAGDMWFNLQIHDELLCECVHQHVKFLGRYMANIMEGAYKLSVQLKAKYAYSTQSWGAIEK